MIRELHNEKLRMAEVNCDCTAVAAIAAATEILEWMQDENLLIRSITLEPDALNKGRLNIMGVGSA